MEIDFVPLVVVQVWRVLIWFIGLGLFGSIIVFLPHIWRARNDEEPVVSRWTVFLYAAVGVFVLQAVVAQAIRWSQPLVAQGLPLTTIALVFCVKARYERSKARIW